MSPSIVAHEKEHKTKLLFDSITRKKLSGCGAYSVYVERHGVRVPIASRTCSLSLCAHCAGRLDKKRQAAAAGNAARVFSENKGAVFVALTITHKVSDTKDVRRRVRRNLSYLQKMRRTQSYGVLGETGYMRSVELKEVVVGRINGHVHVILAFERGRFSLEALDELCKKYFHSFDLRLILPKGRYKRLQDALIAYAAYISKSFADTVSESRLLHFFQVGVVLLKGMRKYASGGIFSGVFTIEKPTAQPLADGEKIWLKNRRTGEEVSSFYQSIKGVYASFFGGKKRGRTAVVAPVPVPARPLSVLSVEPVAGGYGAVSENRVSAALSLFDKLMEQDKIKAAASNARFARVC